MIEFTGTTINSICKLRGLMKQDQTKTSLSVARNQSSYLQDPMGVALVPLEATSVSQIGV